MHLETWAADPPLRAAVASQNQAQLTMSVILQRDSAWVAGTAVDLQNAVLNGACAARLRQLAARERYYHEVMLMDNQGALVCASSRTSDYWQGDEDKWIRTWNGGSGRTFIDQARLDASAGEQLIQISLPVFQGSTLIGALTVGISVADF